MCGRFTLTDTEENIERFFHVRLPVSMKFQFNICPGQKILIVYQENQQKTATFAHWGFIPRWQKEEDIGTQWINARLETIDSKPLFKEGFQHHRCLIIATGFYEWAQTKIKQPYYFHFNKNSLFAFAGILSQWEGKEGNKITSAVILTTEANDIVNPVPHRMPLILKPESYEQWLLPEVTLKEQWLKKDKCLNGSLKNYPVSTYVNNPSHQAETCIEPLKTEP